MNVFGSFGMDNGWGNATRVNGAAALPKQQVSLSTPDTPNITIDQAREQFRAASAALADAFRTFRNETWKAGAEVTISDISGGVEAGTTIVSNSSAVAQSVSEAVEKMNEALADLGNLPNAGAFLRGVETALRRAIDSLGESGAEGLSASGNYAEFRLSVDRKKLAKALEKLFGDEMELEAEFNRLLEGYNRETDEISEPPEPELPPLAKPQSQVRDLSAQFMSEQIISALRLLQPSPRKIEKAYNEINKPFSRWERFG